MDGNEFEETILKHIREVFRRVTRIRLDFEEPTINAEGRPDYEIDALLHLRLPDGRTIGPLAVEVKRRLDRANLAQIVDHARKTKLPTVIATEYVNPKMAETLAEQNIPFIDTAGNAHINVDDVFVLITGRKVPKEFRRPKAPTRAFREAGLKLLLAVMEDKALLNRPYRQIGEVTDVAIGTITNVFDDLTDLGYLQKVGDRRRLRNLEELVHKWADAYIERLREKLVIGRFTAEFDKQWGDEDIERLGAWWGGEVAAAKITEYLKPETRTLYVQPPVGRVQAELGLRRDPMGDVELLKAFWLPNKGVTHGFNAPLIVIYADLLAIGDDRTIETARVLYEKYIDIHRR